MIMVKVMRKILNVLAQFRRSILRKKYTREVMKRAKSCGIGLRVNGKSLVTGNTVLGNNVNFNGIKILGGGEVQIGDNFHSWTECMIITHVHNYDNGEAIPYDSTYIHKDVVIKDNVWLCNRVIILGGVTIGEGAIIQAGSVVTSDIPDCAIAGGHPAKVFKYRDKEHYYRLKALGRYH